MSTIIKIAVSVVLMVILAQWIYSPTQQGKPPRVSKNASGIIAILIFVFVFSVGGAIERAVSPTEASVIRESETSQELQDMVIKNFTRDKIEAKGYKPSVDTKNWNVAQQKYNGTIRWIVTFTDPEYGRVKHIAEWNGEIDDNGDAYISSLYLLVKGDEIYNNLRND